MEIPPWKIIKDPISAKKGSITSKNSEVFLRNLTHSQKPSYWRLGLVESFNFVADMKWEASFYQNSDHLENTDLLGAERG